MALHELATNAGKYGALSNADGQIHVQWSLQPCASGERFSITWKETGGPAGFGSVVTITLVRRAMNADVKATYEPHGITWSLECEAAAVIERDDPELTPVNAA